MTPEIAIFAFLSWNCAGGLVDFISAGLCSSNTQVQVSVSYILAHLFHARCRSLVPQHVTQTVTTSVIQCLRSSNDLELLFNLLSKSKFCTWPPARIFQGGGRGTKPRASTNSAINFFGAANAMFFFSLLGLMLHEFDACAKFISELTRHDVSDLLKILLEDQHLCYKLMSSAVQPESSLQSLLKKVRSSLRVLIESSALHYHNL